MDYLLFRLYGPMASWGDIAIGESRHSFSAPTKSAIMGMVAAALGIRREEEAQHLALNSQYQMAIAVQSEGQRLKDYHTVQVPDSVGKFRYRTRRDELIQGKDRLGTVLSSREYRTDAYAVIALKADADAPFALPQLAQALKAPIFTLYLGRKSCPLAAPLQPEVITAENFQQAFTVYQPKEIVLQQDNQARKAARHLGHPDNMQYYWEGDIDAFAEEDQLEQEQLMSIVRHDKLSSRKRWQFDPQRIYHYRSTEGV